MVCTTSGRINNRLKSNSANNCAGKMNFDLFDGGGDGQRKFVTQDWTYLFFHRVMLFDRVLWDDSRCQWLYQRPIACITVSTDMHAKVSLLFFAVSRGSLLIAFCFHQDWK